MADDSRFDAPFIDVDDFASFRAGSHRHGTAGRGAPVWNLARDRVIVGG